VPDPAVFKRDYQESAMCLLYDLFLVQRPESWGPADAAWLTPLQVAITTVVTSARRPLYLTQIATALGCTRQTVSRSVANLEKKSYVLRRRSPIDRRRVEVHPRLTAEVPAEWAREWDHRIPAAIELMPLGKLTTVTEGLETLVDHVRFVDRHRMRR
jgi:DNA-binding MarR family transcriptional regulator